uniref:Uncharacterized protein n=1 Tax=Glossina pallidipes TaxID=7398 RepID=A0A1B0AHM8_GLOPL
MIGAIRNVMPTNMRHISNSKHAVAIMVQRARCVVIDVLRHIESGGHGDKQMATWTTKKYHRAFHELPYIRDPFRNRDDSVQRDTSYKDASINDDERQLNEEYKAEMAVNSSGNKIQDPCLVHPAALLFRNMTVYNTKYRSAICSQRLRVQNLGQGVFSTKCDL